MQILKQNIKHAILRRLRMEHVRHILPNKLCFYGHLISDMQNHAAWGAYRYPSSAEFSEFVERLRKMGYETVPLHAYFTTPPNKKVVSMTFDDGYAAMLQHSHPVLKALNVPYAVFIHPPGQTPPAFPVKSDSNQGNLFLSQQDIIKLKKDGVHIGFHGSSHQDLASAHDTEAILQHVAPPGETAQLLSAPLTYAYPYRAPTHYQHHDQVIMECGFEHIMDTKGLGSIGNHHFRIPLDIHHLGQGIRNACEFSLLLHALSPQSRHKSDSKTK